MDVNKNNSQVDTISVEYYETVFNAMTMTKKNRKSRINNRRLCFKL